MLKTPKDDAEAEVRRFLVVLYLLCRDPRIVIGLPKPLFLFPEDNHTIDGIEI